MMRVAWFMLFALVGAVPVGLVGAVRPGLAETPAVVSTRAGIVQGEALLGNNRLELGGQTVDWADVVLFHTGSQPSVGPAHAVHLVDGQRWLGRVVGLAEGKLSFEADLWGGRVQEIPVERVVRVELIRRTGRAAQPAEANLAQGVLRRMAGPPIVGRLQAIDAQTLLVASPLGLLRVARPGVVDYRFPQSHQTQPEQVQPELAAADETALTDGTVLRGPTRPEGDRIVVAHGNGELRFPIDSVAHVRRFANDAIWLAQCAYRAEQSPWPLGDPPAPIKAQQAAGAHCLVLPTGCRLTWTLPAAPPTAAPETNPPAANPPSAASPTAASPPAAGQSRRLAAILVADRRVPGRVFVRAVVGSTEAGRTAVGPAAEPVVWSCDLPAGGVLAVEAVAAQEAAPAAVLLVHPHLIPFAAAEGPP